MVTKISSPPPEQFPQNQTKSTTARDNILTVASSHCLRLGYVWLWYVYYFSLCSYHVLCTGKAVDICTTRIALEPRASLILRTMIHFFLVVLCNLWIIARARKRDDDICGRCISDSWLFLKKKKKSVAIFIVHRSICIVL